MYGLNIHFQSFTLNSNLLQENDKVRISITTIPEKKKDAFVVNYKIINHIHHFFSVNITEETEKIIFVFRKKSFIHNDPIIASTVVHSNCFPNGNNSNNLEIKSFNLYEPNHNRNINREILGEMKIQFSVTTASTVFPTFPTFPQYDICNNQFNFDKMQKNEDFSKSNKDSIFINNENQRNNNSLIMKFSN